MAITLKQVAGELGLSPATVSLALRGKSAGKRHLSQKTIIRIRKTAKNMGYCSNFSAASLRTKKTNTIGVLLSSIYSSTHEILAGIKKTVFPEYVPVLASHDYDGETERIELAALISHRVDGIIAAFSGDNNSIRVYHDIADIYNIPLVLIERSIPGQDFPLVRYDNFSCTFQGTQALIKLGHRRIHYYSVSCADESLENTKHRISGYATAMSNAGLADQITVSTKYECKGWSNRGELKHIAKLIMDSWQNRRPATALFVENDYLAYEIINECAIRKIAVPEDVSIMSIGDAFFSSSELVHLSTVKVYPEMMGCKAAELLIRLMKKTPYKTGLEILPVKLMMRGTTAPNSNRGCESG